MLSTAGSDIGGAMYGLTTTLIRQFNDVFSRYPQLETVVIFGSRATERYRPGSDIDLAIIIQPEGELNLNQIASELDDLNTPYMVDLVDIRQVSNDALLEHIRDFGKPFYPVHG